MKSLVRVIINEQLEKGEKSIYKSIFQFLYENNIEGATMRRGDAVLDDKGNIHFININEDIYFDNLPIIIESVMDNGKIDTTIKGISNITNQGQISVISEIGEKEMNDFEYCSIKIYTKENAKWFKQEEYEKVFETLKEMGVIWATMTKGIMGYGKDKIIHKSKILSFSEQLPIVIECMVKTNEANKVISKLEEIVTQGVVFTVPTTVLVNK